MNDMRIPERNEIADSDKWDLTPLYPTDEEWDIAFRNTELKLDGYTEFRGTLQESETRLRQALDFDRDLSRQIEKLYTYAHLKSDGDTSNQEYLAMYQRAVSLYTKASELSSFLSPEIQSLPDEMLSSFQKDPGNAEYAFFIEQEKRYKPHTRNHEVEEVLAMTGEVAHASAQTFKQLDNADLTFGTITLDDGTEQELSHGSLHSLLSHPSREIRESAFFQYYKGYEDHQNTIASTLLYSNKKDAFYARVRNFESTRKKALFADDVPLSVYDNLVDTVRNNFDPLFSYFNLRKELLGLDELHFYDTYVPLVDEIDFAMTYDEAVDTCIAALQPLGKEYCDTLEKGLREGWVDRYENRGKRSGAYSSGCYDSPPYILMNYRDDTINSVYTLIHEAGHSMHSLYSIKNQPYSTHGYTIFVAEVASTFNETLLTRYLLEKYKNDSAMTAYILNREIDNVRATLYRQTMFAEFEKVSHEIVESGEPLTLERIRSEYRKLLEAYFGNTMVIDDVLELEALRIPHFYSAFYVYKYSTGISAALSLAKKVMEEGDAARDAYLNFLTLGGSMFPIDELKMAGVDMSSPAPIEDALRHFADTVTSFSKVMK